MKTEVDKEASVNQLMQKYNIPKTTAWRAKKRGWFFRNYHIRIKDSNGPIEIPIELIQKIFAYLEKNVEYQNAADITQNVCLIAQMKSKKAPKKQIELRKWLFAIAKNELRNFQDQGLKAIENTVANWK